MAAFAPAHAADKMVDKIHFLIPGGAGGGWDGTARGTGEALTKSGLVGSASYENMSGGGGGKAIGYLIENAKSSEGTLMVNSTPIVIRSLVGRFPHNFRDLTMIAGTIGDYAAMIVPADSEIKSFKQLVEMYKKDPKSVSVGGGSVPGGMDHLVAAMAFKSAGADPTKVKYIPYDAGGKLNAALLSGEVKVGSTGFSEAVALAKAGKMRVIGVTSPERVDALPDAPTLKEQGYDAEFVNWRGFFAAPGLPKEKADAYRKVIEAMYKTSEWEEVRKRNGWVNIHNSGDAFVSFLEKQEGTIKSLMVELGFLKS
ncbi:MAG: tripartite tricarboxylate transporter substrate-binding protein [Pseudomonadota bacterium]